MAIANYLDTSAVRSLGGALADVAQMKLGASALTVVELVSAATESEKAFSLIRPGLKTVLTHPAIDVVWELPDAIFAHAFEWMTKNCTIIEERIDSLRFLAECIIEAESFAAALRREHEAKLRFDLVFWREYDTVFGVAYKDATRSGNRQVREAFDKAKRGEARSGYFPPEILTGSFQDFCTWVLREERALNRTATVAALASRVAADMSTGKIDDSMIGEITDSYNGSIDVFVDAFSWRAMMDHKDSRVPGRNDALDLAHFAYLSAGSALVTADRGMGDTARAIGVRVLLPSELAMTVASPS